MECEFDKVLGKERIKSCSVVDTRQSKSQIKKANAGNSVKKIFSKQQEATLVAAFGPDLTIWNSRSACKIVG